MGASGYAANMDEAAVLRYHEATKHHPHRPSANPYGLEWANQPELFKRYPGTERQSPPGELEALLRLGAGVHPRRRDPHYRTFMSAGALHPLELYVGTSAGLFHYHPGEQALHRLRHDDPRAGLARAAAAPELSDAGVVLVVTGILWRTAWKYGARGWRHIFWDAGAMLANLLALTASARPRLLTAFVDTEVAQVLGVELPREAPVALLAAGRAHRPSGSASLPLLELESPPLSAREHRFPEAEEAHLASSLTDGEEVRAWREEAMRSGTRTVADEPPGSLERVILRRGSARGFTAEPVAASHLEAVLAWASSCVPGDLPAVCSNFVVAHAVDGIDRGIYRFDHLHHRLERVSNGADRRMTAHLCLDQPLGGEAAATIFFTASLDAVLSRLGERGYRAAQLDAGIRAGRAALGAYARGLGATGLTFYDDEVRRALGTGEEPMMCLAMGIDAYRAGLRPAGEP